MWTWVSTAPLGRTTLGLRGLRSGGKQSLISPAIVFRPPNRRRGVPTLLRRLAVVSKQRSAFMQSGVWMRRSHARVVGAAAPVRSADSSSHDAKRHRLPRAPKLPDVEAH